jgi:hypothetical protein
MVAINTSPYDDPFAVGFLSSAAALTGNAGSGVIDYSPNPLQSYAFVERIITEAEEGLAAADSLWAKPGGPVTSVDVRVPGVYRREWAATVRLLSMSSSGPAAAAAITASMMAVPDDPDPVFYRANVDRERVVAHSSTAL